MVGTRWIKTSDGFIPAPAVYQPKHTLHAKLLDAVEAFHVSSFDAFALNILVTPHEFSYELFHFEFDWTRERTKTLGVRVNRQTEIIEVWLHQRWITLTSYLTTEASRLPTNPNRAVDIDPISARNARYRHQCDWWNANGKCFNFQALPTELREHIYFHCSPTDAIEPYAQDHLRKWGAWRTSYCNGLTSGLLKSHPAVTAEMRFYLFRRLPLLLNHKRFITKTLVRNPHFPRTELTRLTLAFPGHVDYLKFFGFSARDPVSGWMFHELPDTSAKALSRGNLPCLKRFEIVIPERHTLNDEGFLAGGCQMKAAGWVFEALWPFVQGQPLLITGMVKKTQKEAFEERAMEALDKWNEQFDDTEDGGVVVSDHDIEAYEQIQAEEDSETEDEYSDDDDDESEEEFDEWDQLPMMRLPPSCHCHPHCLRGEWSDE